MNNQISHMIHILIPKQLNRHIVSVSQNDMAVPVLVRFRKTFWFHSGHELFSYSGLLRMNRGVSQPEERSCFAVWYCSMVSLSPSHFRKKIQQQWKAFSSERLFTLALSRSSVTKQWCSYLLCPQRPIESTTTTTTTKSSLQQLEVKFS